MSNDEVVLDGKTYVSSKRAAQLSDYAQDYIGQLCRAGTADCRRINGLWYVTMASLEVHKTASAEAKARAFESINADSTRNQYNESVLSFSGEEFVSSRHGAELTGYNPDYVTQLARDGKVRGRQIGSRWYVSKKDLMANKEKNDEMLAVVQSEAVGVLRRDEKSNNGSISRPSVPELVYRQEIGKPLLPMAEKAVVESPYTIVTPLAINTDASLSTPRTLVPPKKLHYNASSATLLNEDSQIRGKKSSKSKIWSVTLVSIAVLALAIGGYWSMKNSRILASRFSKYGMEALVSSGSGDINGTTGSFLLRMATDVITYERTKH